jgi:plasmid stabilization system protein ParE
MNVAIAEAAWDDLYRIGLAIKRDSPKRAETFVEELYDSCREIGLRPYSFPLIERKDSGIRRRVYGRYLIFYRVADDAVEILHILHGAMDYEKILFPEP